MSKNYEIGEIWRFWACFKNYEIGENRPKSGHFEPISGQYQAHRAYLWLANRPIGPIYFKWANTSWPS